MGVPNEGKSPCGNLRVSLGIGTKFGTCCWQGHAGAKLCSN